ncbi:hypothetical protein PO124_34425 [Bacillus licheniformis]|nr:hypothetical protein [Bacillus licheniformis]
MINKIKDDDPLAHFQDGKRQGVYNGSLQGHALKYIQHDGKASKEANNKSPIPINFNFAPLSVPRYFSPFIKHYSPGNSINVLAQGKYENERGF